MRGTPSNAAATDSSSLALAMLSMSWKTSPSTSRARRPAAAARSVLGFTLRSLRHAAARAASEDERDAILRRDWGRRAERDVWQEQSVGSGPCYMLLCLLAELPAMVVNMPPGHGKPLFLRSQYVHIVFSVGSFDPSCGEQLALKYSAHGKACVVLTKHSPIRVICT